MLYPITRIHTFIWSFYMIVHTVILRNFCSTDEVNFSPTFFGGLDVQCFSVLAQQGQDSRSPDLTSYVSLMY